MNRRFIRFLLLFAALWLPVQTMAGMSVSVCMNMESHGGMAAHQEQGVADAAAAMPCHEAMDEQHAAHPDNGCDNCEICHLASAGFMPSAAISNLPCRRSARVSTRVLIAAPPSFIAEPPQHPPRQTAPESSSGWRPGLARAPRFVAFGSST
jgi:hypothetical protein